MRIEDGAAEGGYLQDYADLDDEFAFGTQEGWRARIDARRVSYRRFLQGTVLSASELVAAVATPAELARGLAALWPPTSFDETHPAIARTRGSWFGGSGRLRLKQSRRRADARRIDDLATMGAMLRAPGDDVPGVGVRIVRDALEVRIADRAFLLTTRAGELRLDVEVNLPDTIVAALPGRLLSDVVDHPLLAGRPHRIVRATGDGWYLSLFATVGVVPYRMPWPELLGTPQAPPRHTP